MENLDVTIPDLSEEEQDEGSTQRSELWLMHTAQQCLPGDCQKRRFRCIYSMAIKDFFLAYEESIHRPQWTVRWMGIRKDDVSFHFVILCYAIGALLVCYYYCKDWTVSLGIGLIIFASLETTGIYFDLVYRIRCVLDSFVPLIDRFRPRDNCSFY